jgi:cellulose synthase/poly-beta-1,6-N-acetylglucosamine synthase-like glycosyltransferase/peptidoglycan/xylan/chitin deacetylase (PgdA/CDA1 family)/spore germination protein YaaH
MADRKPIFYDHRRRRWRYTRRALEISGALFALVVVIFLFDVARKPDLPGLLLPDSRPLYHALHIRPRAKPVQNARAGRRRRIEALGKVPAQYDPLRAAFYVSWDSNSLAALQKHYHDIDLLIPEALHAVSADGRLDLDQDPRLAAWEQSAHLDLPEMSLVNNYDGTNWQIAPMVQMLAQPASRSKLASALANFAFTHHQAGIVVDFEEIPEKSQGDFILFARELGQSLRGVHQKLMIALPAADWSYDYAYLGAQADAIILMNYDQHWSTSKPGPIVAQDWYQRNLQNILKIVPPQKIVMGIANYAYDWPEATAADGHPVAQAASFQWAINRAIESGSDINLDSDTLNLHYSYEDGDITHNVWMLDAVTAYNELRAAERAGVQGTALWRLGSEDPSLWDIWDTTHPDDAIRAKIEVVPPGYDLILEGGGDIWRITATPTAGKRSFDYDPDTDTFTDDDFVKYPLAYRIEQTGDAPHKLAFSFDDGPDPQWTPKILDVLKAKHAPATFFVIGVEADISSQIIQREYAEGNEIGNHTYTHPDIDTVSRSQLTIELNLTERLLESILGVKTILFRPPYGIDHEPEQASEVEMLPLPQSMGYLLVGARIDPHDWGEVNGTGPPPADAIYQRVVEQAESPALRDGGHIILMHDGGGNRSQTLAALPRIIDRLRADGFEFVTTSDLLGQTRAQVMPPLTRDEWVSARTDAVIFQLFHWARRGIAFIFMAGILLVSCRALIVGLLALVEKFRAVHPDHPEYRPEVSVLIPAYNEQAAIVATVASVLAAHYSPLEVIVVDDGSADETGDLVEQSFLGDPRVRLIRQSNHGKPAALNRSLGEARGDIIVTIDADTRVDAKAIPRLVRNFTDPKVGAVAGNVKVLNRSSWLTRWQALEYITSQNLEKRAFDLLNCIPVVPGALGAWRASAMRECGGFSSDTVAEDTDLTLTLRRRGWKISYDEEAIARTEAPDTTDALIGQRFRWTFGTLQAIWKHSGAICRRRYGTLGWIAIPNIFLFQILLPLVSPVIDLLFLTSIALWGLAQLRIAHLPQLWTAEDVERSLIFFAAFMLIDLLTCVIAFALERHEDWTLLAPILIQRFYYRQMMYLVLFRALREALQGRAVGWRGVEPELPTPATTG